MSRRRGKARGAGPQSVNPEGAKPAPAVLGTSLLVLALRTDDGRPCQPASHGSRGSSRLGSVVVAIPPEDLGTFALEAAASTFYLALAEPEPASA